MLEVRVPSSKSETQRALVLAALAQGTSRLLDPLDCDDSRVLLAGLQSLGVAIDRGHHFIALSGGGDLRSPGGPIYLGNAGTAMRFTAALSLLADGPLKLQGDDAMSRRPMPGLLGALRELGAEVTSHGKPDCPPLTVSPPAHLGAIPGQVSLDPAGSSQQLSALLLVAPRLPAGLRIRVTGALPSRPYVDLTLAALKAFGVSVEVLIGEDGASVYRVTPGLTAARDLPIEGDHSSASYPLAAGHLTGTEVRVTNVRSGSAQGDRVFPQLLERLRAPGPRIFNLGDTPDIAPTLATCALFAEGETVLRELAHLRIKESDRLSVLAHGFRQVGADLDELADGLVIRPRDLRGHMRLDPAGDHRMAMCFALLGLRLPGIEIADPGCVTKSYPGFFEMIARFSPRRS